MLWNLSLLGRVKRRTPKTGLELLPKSLASLCGGRRDSVFGETETGLCALSSPGC